jgi:hypothetical protein
MRKHYLSTFMRHLQPSMECGLAESLGHGNDEYDRIATEESERSDMFDKVIEQIWLVVNFVSPFCSHVGGFSDNLWNDFPTFIKKQFLLPLEKQW